MIATPSALQSKFEEHLRNKAIPGNLHGMYQRWLRYYLDFCQMYHVPPKHEKSLPPSYKLRDKQQSQAQQKQSVKMDSSIRNLLNTRRHQIKTPS
jgi:hypothetical protein